jgi:hypothetical protein
MVGACAGEQEFVSIVFESICCTRDARRPSLDRQQIPRVRNDVDEPPTGRRRIERRSYRGIDKGGAIGRLDVR